MAAIEAKGAPDPVHFLFGLGIRHVGAITARDLLKAFGTVEAIADVATRAAAEPEARGGIEAVEGVGPVVAEAMVDFLAEEHNRTAWADLLSVIHPQPFDPATYQTEGAGAHC